MPAKPIPRQLRASALAFAVRCSARDAPPEPSPQPADEEDDAHANGYDAPDDEDGLRLRRRHHDADLRPHRPVRTAPFHLL